jgi:hypothetical protein
MRVFRGSSSIGRRTWALALVAVVCAVAGCGGGSNAGSSSASIGNSKKAVEYTHAIKFAKCMRAHSVSNFPDPQYPNGFSGSALAAVNTLSPAFTSAATVCDKVLPNEGQPTAAEFEQAMTDGVAFAKCMRRHGVSFPDPGIQGSHMTIDLSNVNTNAPAYKHFAKVCATPTAG